MITRISVSFRVIEYLTDLKKVVETKYYSITYSKGEQYSTLIQKLLLPECIDLYTLSNKPIFYVIKLFTCDSEQICEFCHTVVVAALPL